MSAPSRLLILLCSCVLATTIGGCAGKAPGPSVAPDTAAAPDSLAFLSEVPDSLPPESMPVPVLPLGPDGYASLDDLEGLLATAMVQAAAGDYGLAEDHLMLARDQVERPLPAGADSLYAAHRASIGRRATLLEGLLADQAAFAGPAGQADSLLAAGYGRLARYAYPDSLVPATGTRLPAITADLLKMDNQAVRRWENYFAGRGKRTITTWLGRRAAADSLVKGILAEHDLPPELIYLAVIESGLSSRAVSSAAAVGPWQFMADTGRRYGLRTNWWVDERRDLEMSTRAAAAYLQDLYREFGDWALVLAAYNTGPGRVSRRIRQHGHANFWELRLPAQTTAHIPKFIAAARVGEDPGSFGIEPAAAPPLAWDVVTVKDATDLELIARCAEVPVHQVLDLNPALLRGASPPDLGDYPVKVPAGTGARARRALARVPADKRLTWRRHQVARGETLGHIARQWGTTVDDIARLNKLGDVHLIRPGDQLLIPMPASLEQRARARSAEKGHYVPPAGYQRVSHTVRSGDTLGGIAHTLGVTVNHLRKVNNIHGTNIIHPGQRIYAYRPGRG
jgi:membrane-bound lytic murein transglycosylase D